MGLSVLQWIVVTGLVTATVTSMVGSLLVVGGRSMIGEGLSHAVLPGIVAGFLLTGDPHSPWLIVSAAAAGLVMVAAVDWIARGGGVDDDAALGIVFSAMFAVGVLMISWIGPSSTLDADCVIDGNLALASLDRTTVGGVEIPRPVVTIGLLGILVATTIVVGYKEYQLVLFDPTLGQRLKRTPRRWLRWWLALTALVTVAAFQVAGSVVIVALMTAPAATARLVTRRLGPLIVVAVAFAIIASLIGSALGLTFNVTPTSPTAAVSGLIFLGVWLGVLIRDRWTRSSATILSPKC